MPGSERVEVSRKAQHWWLERKEGGGGVVMERKVRAVGSRLSWRWWFKGRTWNTGAPSNHQKGSTGEWGEWMEMTGWNKRNWMGEKADRNVEWVLDRSWSVSLRSESNTLKESGYLTSFPFFPPWERWQRKSSIFIWRSAELKRQKFISNSFFSPLTVRLFYPLSFSFFSQILHVFSCLWENTWLWSQFRCEWAVTSGCVFSSSEDCSSSCDKQRYSSSGERLSVKIQSNSEEVKHSIRARLLWAAANRN